MQQIQQIEPQIQAEQSKIEGLKKEITVDNLKKIFNHMDQKYAEAPAYVMEALVGLMRKMRRADIKSVELYTKSYEGFSIGLGRIRLEELNFEHCEDHAKQLNEKYSAQIMSEKEFEIFRPYHNLLKECATKASLGKQMYTCKHEKEIFEAKYHENVREIEKFEMLLKFVDIEAPLRADLENFKTQQFPYFERRNKSALMTWSKFRNEEKQGSNNFYNIK